MFLGRLEKLGLEVMYLGLLFKLYRSINLLGRGVGSFYF